MEAAVIEPCIAVDGGASGCRLAAFDGDGARVSQVRLERHASLSLDPAEAADTVRAGIERLGVDPSWPLYVGLAGSLRPERRAAFVAALGRAVTIVTDGEAQLLGATGGAPGACLAVGTGSVLHWRDGAGRTGMAGGWGYPVGDEGSAAWLGMALLRRYLHARDRGAHATPLYAALEAVTGDDVASLQAWTTSTRSTNIARLAALLGSHDDDDVARELLDAGARCCETLYDAAPEGLPRYLVGGLAGVYAPLLEARGAELHPPAGDALDGLATLARRVPAACPERLGT